MNSFPRQYIRRPDGTIEECTDVGEFATWYRDIKNRRIKRTAVPYGDLTQAIVVSTAFLGFECFGENEKHLFETLVELPGDDHKIMRRYATEEEALKGHDELVRETQARLRVVEEDLEGALAEICGSSKGIQPVLSTPQSLPAPTPPRIKDPGRKAPEPSCKECKGSGILSMPSDLMAASACDCTFAEKGSPGPVK